MSRRWPSWSRRSVSGVSSSTSSSVSPLCVASAASRGFSAGGRWTEIPHEALKDKYFFKKSVIIKTLFSADSAHCNSSELSVYSGSV